MWLRMGTVAGKGETGQKKKKSLRNSLTHPYLLSWTVIEQDVRKHLLPSLK